MTRMSNDELTMILSTLRAHGVRRYRCGDVEVELADDAQLGSVPTRGADAWSPPVSMDELRARVLPTRGGE